MTCSKSVAVYLVAFAFALRLGSSSHAQTPAKIGVVAPNVYLDNYLPMPQEATLKFTNRARCALDSKTAAQQIFLFADSYIVGKLGHNLAKSIGKDPSAMAQDAMLKFRATTHHLLQNISSWLMQRRIPLLPANLIDPRRQSEYTRLARESCVGQGYCSAIDDFVRNLWSQGDARSLGLNYAPSSAAASALNCRYVKDFSALESPLFTSVPDQNTFRQIAESSLMRDVLVGDCADPKLDSRNFALSLKLDRLDERDWEAYGFDYWNSVRIYLSWAWRNLPLKDYGAGEFGEIFRSLSIEESLLLVPAGCGSIVPPSCDSAYLSVNSIRELAQKGSPDSVKALPIGPQDDLIRNPHTGVNTDILDLQGAESPQEWLKNFSSRANANSLLLKNRFNEGLNQLGLLAYNLPVDRLAGMLRDSVRQAGQDPKKLKALYYLCAEFDYAANQNFGILRDKLELIQQYRFLKEAANPWTEGDLRLYQFYYASLASEVLEVCQGLEKSDTWDALPERVDPTGYADWFREILRGSGVSEEGAPTENAQPSQPSSGGLLALRDPVSQTPKVVCADAVACLRLSLSATVGIYSALSYADSMLPLTSTVRGAALFNPYAERTACQVYDPWFKTRASIGELLVDLANAAAFGWNDIPVFASVDIKHGDVINFKSFVDDGKLKFRPIKEKNKVLTTLGIDFSSFTGVPCAVSIRSGEASLNPGVPYVFDGISAGACRASERHHLEVDSNSASNFSGPAGTACISCYLNFSNIAASAGSRVLGAGFNPLKLTVYLFRAFARFRNSITDHNDVPRDFEVDIDQVTRTYLRHGYIPKKCVKKLQRGRDCDEEVGTCDARASDYVRKKIGGFARPIFSQTLDSETERVVVQSTQCKGQVDIELRHTFRNCALGMKVTRQKGTGACAALFR